MSKSSKGVLKTIGDKVMGGLGGKGSSTKKDKDVAALPPAKKAKGVSSEVEGREVEAHMSSGGVHRPGKGKSLASFKVPKSSQKAMMNLLDGVEEEIEEIADVLDVESCHENDLPNLISRYSNKPTTVPRSVLRYDCSIPIKKLGNAIKGFIIRSPYRVRAADATERPFSPREGEVGVYAGHFQCGLTLPLDVDLVRIMNYYELPLCQFTPIAIGAMVGFLHMIRRLDIPFSLALFRLLFRPQVLPDGFMALMARTNRKFLVVPSKVGTKWQRRFFFVRVPADFPLKVHWAKPSAGIFKVPHMSDTLSGFVRRILSAPAGERDFFLLTSEEVLRQVRGDLYLGKFAYFPILQWV